MLAGILKVHNIPLLLVGLLAGWYTSTAIGYTLAIALSSEDYNMVVIVSDVVSFILAFLAPTYYLPTLLPEPAQKAAQLLPSTHVANIIGAACSVDYSTDLAVSAVYLATLTATLTMLIAKTVRRGPGNS